MIKLSCKSCGAKLELTDDIDRFACANCGSEWMVNRSGGVISLKSVEEKLGNIEVSVDEMTQSIKVLKAIEEARREEELKQQAIKNKEERALQEKAKEVEKEKEKGRVFAASCVSIVAIILIYYAIFMVVQAVGEAQKYASPKSSPSPSNSNSQQSSEINTSYHKHKHTIKVVPGKITGELNNQVDDWISIQDGLPPKYQVRVVYLTSETQYIPKDYKPRLRDIVTAIYNSEGICTSLKHMK